MIIAINAWTNDGCPKFGWKSVMRYKGNENGRSNATKRFFTEGTFMELLQNLNARGSARSSLSK